MDKYKFLRILSTLNCFKSMLKAAHWAEVTSYNKHKLLDDLYEVLEKFQDSFAEDGLVIFGNIRMQDITTLSMKVTDEKELVEKISTFAEYVKSILGSEPKFAGLHGLTDSFIHDTKIIQYKYQML